MTYPLRVKVTSCGLPKKILLSTAFLDVLSDAGENLCFYFPFVYNIIHPLRLYECIYIGRRRCGMTWQGKVAVVVATCRYSKIVKMAYECAVGFMMRRRMSDIKCR